MTSDFPEIFAIVRDTIRPPCLQILCSYPVNRDWSRREYNQPLYQIENAPNIYRPQAHVSQSRSFGDRQIHTLRCRHPDTNDNLLVNWWYTSFFISSENHQRIPILEFQTRSWIPVGYTPVAIQTNINEMLHVMSQIQEDRLAEIRSREDARSQRYINEYHNEFYQPRIYTDEYPRIRTPPSGVGFFRNRRRSTSPIVEQAAVRVVEVQVPVERVVVQNKALPLPKSVGDLLLKHAREGSDACPIAATPFAECEKLAVSSCFHIFDASSLATWQADHTTCPVCRCKIENVVSE